MKKILLSLLIIGLVFSQSDNPDTDIFDAWDNADENTWNTAPANPGRGNNSKNDPSECPANPQPGDQFTLIRGTTNLNGRPEIDVEQCWETAESQFCYDEFGKLDDIGYNGSDPYGDLRNDCRIREVEGEKYFDYILSWTKDYQHYDNCVWQEINFIEHNTDSDYIPGETDPSLDNRLRINVPHSTQPQAKDANNNDEYPHDVYFTSPNSRQIVFTVDFEDLEDQWKCHYEETVNNGREVYQWICDIELNVYFSGEIQYTYEFQSITTLDRTVSDTLDVAVQRNVVVGNCCENTLDVSSSLFFCTNFLCTDNDANGEPNPINDNQFFEDGSSPGWFVPDGSDTPVKQVERKQIFYVAHRIDTAEFQNFFLQPVSLHLGPFVPKIHNWKQLAHPTTGNTQNDSTNILLYKVESYVALDKLTITSIALLDDRNSQASGALQDNDDFNQPEGYGGYDFNDADWDPNARRLLAEKVGKDYKIDAKADMSVSEIGQSYKKSSAVGTTSANILLAGLSLIILVTLI